MRKEERHSQTLQRVFPHARFSEREAADRAQAIEAHRRDLGSRLGRNVGAVVAAVDYMLNISGDLVAPTIVEHEELEQLEHRSITDPLTGLYNRYHFDAALQREVVQGSGTQLMATADVALYAAKKSGGNCVVQGEYPAA